MSFHYSSKIFINSKVQIFTGVFVSPDPEDGLCSAKRGDEEQDSLGGVLLSPIRRALK